MADQSAGRVSLHLCFHNGLWTASAEITGEGGTPALFVSGRGFNAIGKSREISSQCEYNACEETITK